jgi:hypothetical protein
MEYINKNEELIEQSLAGRYYILDSEITRFDIYMEDDIVFIDVYFSLPYHRFKADKVLKLHFIDVTDTTYPGINAIVFLLSSGINFSGPKRAFI